MNNMDLPSALDVGRVSRRRNPTSAFAALPCRITPAANPTYEENEFLSFFENSRFLGLQRMQDRREQL